jgi:hypothetical protein
VQVAVQVPALVLVPGLMPNPFTNKAVEASDDSRVLPDYMYSTVREMSNLFLGGVELQLNMVVPVEEMDSLELDRGYASIGEVDD